MADYAGAGREPSLAEMIADPVVQAVMQRDGITESALMSFIAEARLIIALSRIEREAELRKPAA